MQSEIERDRFRTIFLNRGCFCSYNKSSHVSCFIWNKYKIVSCSLFVFRCFFLFVNTRNFSLILLFEIPKKVKLYTHIHFYTSEPHNLLHSYYGWITFTTKNKKNNISTRSLGPTRCTIFVSTLLFCVFFLLSIQLWGFVWFGLDFNLFISYS